METLVKPPSRRAYNKSVLIRMPSSKPERHLTIGPISVAISAPNCLVAMCQSRAPAWPNSMIRSVAVPTRPYRYRTCGFGSYLSDAYTHSSIIVPVVVIAARSLLHSPRVVGREILMGSVVGE